MSNRLVTFLLSGLLILFGTLAVLQPPARYHGYMIIEAPENVSIKLLLKERVRFAECEATIASMSGAILVGCPTCRIQKPQCLKELDVTQQRLLYAESPDTALVRIPGNVAFDVTPHEANALAKCQESQSLAAKGAAPTTCYSINIARSIDEPAKNWNVAQALWALLALIAAGLAAWFTCWLIIRYEYLHAHLSHDAVNSHPQNFHSIPTPRIGGIALLTGLLAGGGILLALQARFDTTQFGFLLLAGTPAFLGGVAEDVTKKAGVGQRLLLTLLAGSLGTWLLGAILDRLDIPGIDTALLWLPFAVAFTIFAIGGVANAINITDGYNGLAGGFAVVVLAAMAWVALEVGDGFVFTTAFILIGTLLGFLAWNWPTGRIFLGDGGAYLLGFILATLSVLLVVRNPVVSPWFPMLLLAYPVFETLFSIYRRTFRHGDSPGHPDALHLHQLIYMRLARVFVGSRDPILITRRNSMVAAYIWAMSACCVFPAIFLWDQTDWLMVFTIVFCATYIWLYRRIVGWRAPAWLIRSRSGLPPHALPLDLGK